MKTLRQIELESVKLLSPLYGDNEATSIVRQLLDEYCGILPRDYVIDPDMEVDTRAEASSNVVPVERADLHARSFEQALQMCRDARPVQYVMGRSEFYYNEFYVCEGVLIPRPETEELVDKIVKEVGPASSILDIGTGSGCIALSLASRLPQARVVACDISEDAAAIFAINKGLIGCRAEFFAIDILKDELLEQYDVIVSNPPYVLDSEREYMRANVLDYEPHLALFVPDDNALLFYRRIAEQATTHLNDGGLLYFEINENFGAETLAMLDALGFVELELVNDMFNKARMVKALWQSTMNQ